MAQQRRRRIKKKAVAKAALLLALAIFMVWCVCYLIATIKAINSSRDSSFPTDPSQLGVTSGIDPEAGLSDDQNDSSITNIALFGVDQREDEPCRSDVIMIASVDKRHNKIKLISVMRDSYVPIDGHGSDKLNAAYFYGGPVLAIKTLNQVFQLDITDYVTVNFSEMARIVDAVGGVEIEISEDERKDANHNMIEQARQSGEKIVSIDRAGKQTLNGMQAVAYARIRYVGNADFERTQRQRRVMMEIFNKGKKMSPLQYPGLIQELFPVVHTSLDLEKILDLAGIMLREVSFEDIRIPCNGDLIGDGDLRVGETLYLNYDLESARDKIHKFIYQDIKPEP